MGALLFSTHLFVQIIFLKSVLIFLITVFISTAGMLTPERQKNPIIDMNSMFYLKSPSAAAAELTGIHD